MLGRRLSNDYFVIIRRDPRLPTWSWEILRRSTPLGIKLTGHDFELAMAARLAGESALKDLLYGIARDAHRLSLHRSAFCFMARPHGAFFLVCHTLYCIVFSNCGSSSLILFGWGAPK